MPTATVFQLDNVCAKPTPIGSMSYKIGDTFADVRRKLGPDFFTFQFEFYDESLRSRMEVDWEKAHSIDECGEKIIVIPENVFEDVHQPLGNSSKVSNVPSTTDSQSSNVLSTTVSQSQPDDPYSWLQPNDPLLPCATVDVSVVDQPCVDSETLPEEVDPQVSYTSVYMSHDLAKVWQAQVHKLKDHMKLVQCEDHRWKVRTWDKDNIAYGKIECCECDICVDGASKEGTMDKVSIVNSFTNFKNKHLLTPKHVRNVAKNRGQTVDIGEVQRRALASGMSNKATLEQHVQIVERVNDSQSAGQKIFNIVGDLDRDPVELHKYRLCCTFCHEHLVMVPKQRNLEANLQSHCAGVRHLNAVSKRQRESSNIPILSRRPGRPRNADKRDKKQRTIECFVTVMESHQGFSRASRLSSSDKSKGQKPEQSST